jgi:hypothetical protein
VRSCLGIIGVLLALAIVAALSTSWVVVYVDDREEGIKVLIPAPMIFLADIALHGGDVYADEVDLPPEAKEFLLLLLPLVEKLVQAPDFELLHVEESDLDVSIRKTGNLFDISVVDGDQVVRVKVPVSALERVARAVGDGQLQIGELARMLHGISRTQVVNVSMPDQDVRVWIW